MIDIVSIVSTIFAGKPKYTENDYPDLTGRVYIVTGPSVGGIGYYVCKLLLLKNAKVYLVGRSPERINMAINKLVEELGSECSRRIGYFIADYADLTTIRPGVEKFLQSETRLDGIVHNAGVIREDPSDKLKTAQGYELVLGVNVIAPFLLQSLLDDILIRTSEHATDVRIVWVSSLAHVFAPQDGFNLEDPNYNSTKLPILPSMKWILYGQSKALAIQMAILWAKMHPSNVVSLSCHPGLITSNMSDPNKLLIKFARRFLEYDTIYGAYVELYALLHPGFATRTSNGLYITPFDKVSDPRRDIIEAANDPIKGPKIWGWLEEQVKPYL